MVHKEEIGEGITSLGMSLRSEPPGMEPTSEKFWLLYESTLFLASQEEAQGAVLETVVCLWTWFLLLNRPGFSILDRSYEFCRTFRDVEKEVRLWPSVRDELGV